MKIPIVVISDNKLAMETKNKETYYELNVLITSDFTQENIDKIKSIEEQYNNECSISFVNLDSRFENIKNETGHIANACAYKFCISESLPMYDKILYLDTDIIVFEDLGQLYNSEIGDNYFAGVFSICHYLYREGLAEELKIPNLLYYVNAGVLVFNLKKIREDNIIQKAVKLIGSYKDSVDQHIWNKICYPHIKLLPIKYNVTQTNDNEYDMIIAQCAHIRRELEESRSPVIYHYTGIRKPWNCLNIKYGILWLRNYNKTKYKDIAHKFVYDAFRSPQTFNLLERIFSVKNEYYLREKYKVITIMGITIKKRVY